MTVPPTRRSVAGVLAVCLGLLELMAPLQARAQMAPCATQPPPESFGPTDINAVTGNRRLSVALNQDATVTVMKWPSPSYYDQIKYRTTDPSLPRMGALPNEGSFLGLAWRPRRRANRPPPSWRFSWLRRWTARQRFQSRDGDVVVTRFQRRKVGLTVLVRDVVAHDRDALVRNVTVRRTRRSRVRTVRVIAFANFNPVFSKTEGDPTDDWCTEEDNDAGATYLGRRDAVVAERAGVDASTGEPSSVAVAIGFVGRSDGHHVGADVYEVGGPGRSAYEDARDGRLSGGRSQPGQSDAALARDLGLGRVRRRSARIILTAGPTAANALRVLKRMRRRSAANIIAAKAAWWRSWLKRAALPQNAPAAVTSLAKRSLITMRQAADVRGLVVTSIATQAPYGLDWIRHGAYINRALLEAGHPEMVRAHNRRYAALQSRPTNPVGSTPFGNWAVNYYADGTVGQTLPSYEIDQTGLGIWTLYDAFERTGGNDLVYLFDVYEAIRRAAFYLVDTCRNALTGLHCPAPDETSATPGERLAGAQAVWLGLGAAAKAARAAGEDGNAQQFEARRDQIGAAIETAFFDDDGCSGCYTSSYEVGGTLLWPVGYLEAPSKESIEDTQAHQNWLGIRGPILDPSSAEEGHYEARALLGNAYAWDDADDAGKKALARQGLEWITRVPTTNRTGFLGEHWLRRDGAVRPIVSQPHVWTHAMFYLAALKTYGKQRYVFGR